MVGKQGIFFTATALLMLAIFLLSFFVYPSYREQQRSLVIQSRVESMDDFIDDILLDVENAAYISGFRSILAMEEYIAQNQTYVDDAELRFSEAFFNGTVNGENMSLIQNNTFPLWIGRIEDRAGDIGVEVYFENISVSINQSTPWELAVNLEFNLVVGDDYGTAYWEKPERVTALISIADFDDPIYRVGTGGHVFNTIRLQEVPYFVDNETNSTSFLLNHTASSRYITFSGAPSFLMRLEGDLGMDANGIESLVYIPELDDQDLDIKDSSVVDFVYFGNISAVNYSVAGMPAWFRMDGLGNMWGNETHITRYSLEGLTSG